MGSKKKSTVQTKLLSVKNIGLPRQWYSFFKWHGTNPAARCSNKIYKLSHFLFLKYYTGYITDIVF
jgi:hypothetical protein